MSTGNSVLNQYLTFALDGETFAVDVIKTREILNLTTITQVPQTPDFMLGVINLRSSVVPVIDMRLKFGMPSIDQSVDSCIIVMEVEVEEDLVTVGALVDSVQEVVDLDKSQIEPPPRLGTRLRIEFLKGMGNQNGNFIMILNIDKVFSCEELSLVQDVAEEVV